MERRSMRLVPVHVPVDALMEPKVAKVVKKRARGDEADKTVKVSKKTAKDLPQGKSSTVVTNTAKKGNSTVTGTKNNAALGADEDEFGVHAMTVAAIKDLLNARDLSTNGAKKVLSKRLIERLVKEKDVTYKPKPKGRFCKECAIPTLMRKRNGVRGPFFGCTNYPACHYTESRGFAMVSNKPEPWGRDC